MKEIDAVMKKHDIAGAAFLSDGNGNGEFKIYADHPTWSMLRFLPHGKNGGVAVHTKMHMQSRPVETNRTVNALFSTLDMMGNVWLMINDITKDFETKCRIEKTVGRIIPHVEEPQ